MTQLRQAHITIFPKDGSMTFTEEEIGKIYGGNVNQDKIKYYIVQGEYTKDKRQHFQIYAQFSGNLRYSAVKKAFDDDTIHIEPIRYGKVDDCRRYCTNDYKDADGNPKDIWMEHKEFGEMKVQGKRTDLEHSINRIKEGTKINKMLLEEDTKFAQQYTQYFRTFREIELLTQQQIQKEDVKDVYNDTIWKDWQQKILDNIEQEPNGRTINWIWESEGKVGKSYLGDYIVATKDAYHITGGKKQDILYAYGGQKIIILDLARDIQEKDYIYDVVETLLGRVYLNTKYESRMMFKPKVHLIVFANFPPDTSKLSKDRWDITDINDYNKVSNQIKVEDWLADSKSISSNITTETDWYKNNGTTKDEALRQFKEYSPSYQSQD